MKTLFHSAIAIALFAIVSACNQTSKPTEATSTDSASHSLTAATYTCTMHPEVTSNKPGKCPKCGMDLVKNETSQLPDSAAVLTDSLEHLNKSN
ncbi:MAG: hypothetical protein JWN56_586 [Sphingobacteriales bacterium]|nr:hypothetical protein [Sphingobacteriales bacterium]